MAVDQASRAPADRGPNLEPPSVEPASGDFPDPRLSAARDPHYIEPQCIRRLRGRGFRADRVMSTAGLNWRVLLALFCCAFLALAPALAEARAGFSFGGRPSSIGSRGARSWENNGAQPLNRGPTPPRPYTQPGVASGTGNSAYGGSFFQRHPFLTGLAGGAFGAWLFGHGANALGTGGGTGSALGVLLWVAVIAALVWFVLRFLRRRTVSSGWPGGGAGSMPRLGTAGAAMPAGRGRDVNLADADLQSFQRLHAAIQDAWSAGDRARLQRLTTPEMLSHFSEELARNTSRGLRNIVADVRLLNGELSESWEERDRQYATAFLRWRAIDYVVRLATSPADRDNVVGGDPRRPVETEEVWTFVRRRGGDWLLSAVQQV
jgi:predicted lipid-binding transport protein (Tim44 family)